MTKYHVEPDKGEKRVERTREPGETRGKKTGKLRETEAGRGHYGRARQMARNVSFNLCTTLASDDI